MRSARRWCGNIVGVRGRVAWVVGIGLACAACHSDPFSTDRYGAIGPLNPGSEARLTYTPINEFGDTFHAISPSWSEAGDGIVYSFSPRPFQPGEILKLRCPPTTADCTPASPDSLDTCIGLLPAQGGSALWTVCEIDKWHSDSVDILAAGAVNRAGQLLYEQLTSPTGLPVPVGGHAALWLASSFNPLMRRKLMDLYRDSVGVDQVDPSQVNWISESLWADATTFYAIGEHWHPDRTVDTFGIYRGTVTADGATLTMIPGTHGVIHYALVGSANVLFWIDSSAVIHRTGTLDGSASAAATIPLDTGERLLDIGCNARICVVLATDHTGDNKPAWSLWQLTLATGAVVKARTYQHAIGSAKISPVSGSIMALEGRDLYLLDSLTP